MKKNRFKKQFLDELKKTPVVSAVCSRINLSRQTVYRWTEEDEEFKEEFNKCLLKGRENVSDIMESQLINMGQQGEYRAVIYWLEKHHPDYFSEKKKNEDKREGLFDILRRGLNIK
jgi:hypothetical protein